MTGNKDLLSEFERKAGPAVSYGDGNILLTEDIMSLFTLIIVK